ncbi:MAG: PQQ-binding-like beta-propeller repeat protein [Pirellulales bacterium]
MRVSDGGPTIGRNGAARRDGVWREQGVVEKFPADQIPIRWRAPIGAGYNGPTVAGGRVYVMDRVTEPEQFERVHCFDAATGDKRWSHEYPCAYENVSYTAGPRAAVSVDEGRAYALGTMGHLHCLDAATGGVIWQKDLVAEYDVQMPIWGLAASPLVDGDRVIVQAGGANGACLLAFDKATGAERWRAVDDEASYSSPIIVSQAGQRVLVGWTGNQVVALDPVSGEQLWAQPFERTRMIISIATPVVDQGRLFVSSFYDGSMMLRLADDQLAVEKVWRRWGPSERDTDSLHAMIGTPRLDGAYVYGVDSYGQLRCLDATSGDRVWESLDAVPMDRWSTIHMVQNGERTWMFNERGDLLITQLSPEGFEEISRAHLIDPTEDQLARRGGVCWSHPAFANRCVFARNDREIVCGDLASD